MKQLKCISILIAFLQLAGCQSMQHEELAQEKLNVTDCSGVDSVAVQSIREAREKFNIAIANADLDAVRAVLADDVVLVTGTESVTFIGRDVQVDVWANDFKDSTRLVFKRSPDCVTVSHIYPIAMERGTWHGARVSDNDNFVAGRYFAKWRLVANHWLIEAETYTTLNCRGSLCAAVQPADDQ